jgi:malonate-semialdehyde dehydrogenase (acetylating) / methylmalonate-semialdehyde dehydrogenase
MRTIQAWIAGSETAGASTRFGPVYNPATGVEQAQVALAAAHRRAPHSSSTAAG